KGGSLVHALGKSDTFAAILQRAGNQPVEAMGSAEPGQDRDAYTSQSFGAVFAEVAVDVDTHMVQVRRVVATYDIGTLLNDKTGLNQLMGGITWGCPLRYMMRRTSIRCTDASSTNRWPSITFP